MTPFAHHEGRRTFLRRLAWGASGALLTPALLQACGRGPGGGGEGADKEGADKEGADKEGGELVISSFPLYIDPSRPGAPGSVERFQRDTGIRLRYGEDVNDVRQFFARIRPALAAGQTLPQDIVVLTSWMAARLIELGWLEPLPFERIPNASNLIPSLRKPSWDPEQRFSLPWQSGIAGIAYNIKATGRELRSIDDLFDPALKGRVSALLEMRDTMGLLMLADGKDVSRPSWSDAQPSFDRLERARRDGQIRRFTGNDYADDLAAGNIIVAQAYSGDVVQLQKDNPDLKFVIPATGSSTFVDTMVIPYTTQNQKAAEEWINYIYDRANYAKLIAATKYVPVLSDMTAELTKIDPELADNPLINPSKETLAKLKAWAPLTDEQTQEFNKAYAAVTGG